MSTGQSNKENKAGKRDKETHTFSLGPQHTRTLSKPMWSPTLLVSMTSNNCSGGKPLVQRLNASPVHRVTCKINVQSHRICWANMKMRGDRNCIMALSLHLAKIKAWVTVPEMDSSIFFFFFFFAISSARFKETWWHSHVDSWQYAVTLLDDITWLCHGTSRNKSIQCVKTARLRLRSGTTFVRAFDKRDCTAIKGKG